MTDINETVDTWLDAWTVPDETVRGLVGHRPCVQPGVHGFVYVSHSSLLGVR